MSKKKRRDYTLLSTLKPFTTDGHVDWHQETALFSWSLLPKERLEIVIVGADDSRGRSLVEQYGFLLEPDVPRAFDVGFFSQAPIITDLLRQGILRSSADWIMLINADIIVMPDFLDQLDEVLSHIDLQRYPWPFITVRRRDFTMTSPLLSEVELRSLSSSDARLHKVTGSDIFLTNRAFWNETLKVMPPFIYGRASWDVFFHRHAVLNSSLAVDASQTVICYHPFHGSIIDRSNPEIFHNIMMYEALYADEIILLDDPRWLAV